MAFIGLDTGDKVKRKEYLEYYSRVCIRLDMLVNLKSDTYRYCRLHGLMQLTLSSNTSE